MYSILEQPVFGSKGQSNEVDTIMLVKKADNHVLKLPCYSSRDLVASVAGLAIIRASN